MPKIRFDLLTEERLSTVSHLRRDLQLQACLFESDLVLAEIKPSKLNRTIRTNSTLGISSTHLLDESVRKCLDAKLEGTEVG